MADGITWHEFTIRIPVDDEMLASHDGEKKPPPNDIEDWDGRDIFDAADEAIFEPGEVELTLYGGVVSGPLSGEDD